MHAQPHIKQKNEIKNISAVHKTWRTVNVRSRVRKQFIYVLFQLMSTCAEVAQRLNYWPPNRSILEGRGFESRRQLFFFFSNIHTSDKLEIFFGGRVFSDSQPRSQDAILFTMAKALCTGQRHYNRVHYNYYI